MRPYNNIKLEAFEEESSPSGDEDLNLIYSEGGRELSRGESLSLDYSNHELFLNQDPHANHH
jgi:hypothetical protein